MQPGTGTDTGAESTPRAGAKSTPSSAQRNGYMQSKIDSFFGRKPVPHVPSTNERSQTPPACEAGVLNARIAGVNAAHLTPQKRPSFIYPSSPAVKRHLPSDDAVPDPVFKTRTTPQQQRFSHFAAGKDSSRTAKPNTTVAATATADDDDDDDDEAEMSFIQAQRLKRLKKRSRLVFDEEEDEEDQNVNSDSLLRVSAKEARREKNNVVSDNMANKKNTGYPLELSLPVKNDENMPNSNFGLSAGFFSKKFTSLLASPPQSGWTSPPAPQPISMGGGSRRESKSTPKNASTERLLLSKDVLAGARNSRDDDFETNYHGVVKDYDCEWLVDIRDSDGRRPTEPEYDPSTLYIPEKAWLKMSNFERQYWEIKSQYFDTVVFFKKGKFYELYERDADLSSREFDLKVSHASRGAMRMTGVPGANFEEWAMRFVAKGFKVSKVDQVESMAAKSVREKLGIQLPPSKKACVTNANSANFASKSGSSSSESIIARELTTVLTPGTLLKPMQDQNSYTVALWRAPVSATHCKFYAVFVDTSTAQINVTKFSDSDHRYNLETLLTRLSPKEIIFEKHNILRTDSKMIKSLCPNASLNFGSYQMSAHTIIASLSVYWQNFPSDSWPLSQQIAADENMLIAISGMLAFLQRIRLDCVFSAKQIKEYDLLENKCNMTIDGQTLVNLHLVTDSGPNLFSILDCCCTPMGRRLLRNWVCHPLCRPLDILERQSAISELRSLPLVREIVSTHFAKIPDLERVVNRIKLKNCQKNEVYVALQALKTLSSLFSLLGPGKRHVFRSNLLNNLCTVFPDLLPVINQFETSWDMVTGEPLEGSDPEYDEAVESRKAVEADLAVFLTKVKKSTCGMARMIDMGKEWNLIEVPVATKVPDSWIKKSGTKILARYSCHEISKLNESLMEAREILSAQLRMTDVKMQQRFNESNSLWTTAFNIAAEFDAILSISLACVKHSFECVPEIVIDGSEYSSIEVTDLRHPCFAHGEFIPNNIVLDHGVNAPRSILLTGPNMGGKSTLLRQTGLAVILAQIGSAVPASNCKIRPFDAVFTRIGARDNLSLGHSTFLVELHEAAGILQRATSRSLVLMDELGRGTSTFDGQAIALGVLYDSVFRVRPCMLFATHYVGLVADTETWPIRHSHMACVAEGYRVTFLYKLADGVCPRSHGMNVAAMAGVPVQIVDYAAKIASEFELKHEAGTRNELINTSQVPKISAIDVAHMAALLGKFKLNKDAFRDLQKAVRRRISA